MKTLLLAFALAATATQAQVTPPGMERNDPYKNDLTLISGRTPIGTLMGSLPCADCKAIRYRLTINPDSTYKETLVYEGKSEREFDALGRWYVQADTLLRLRKDAGEANDRFVIEAGRLVGLDMENRRYNGTMADRYVLTPTQGEQIQNDPETERLTSRDFALMQKGISFTAYGQEPGWSAQIKGKSLIVMQMGKKDRMLPIASTIVNKAGATVITLRSGKMTPRLVLREGDCQDAMSGERFTHQATLSGLGQPLKGCGKYLRMEGVAALKGRWVFDSLAGGKPEAGRQVAFIEFNPDGSYTGNTSCNSLRGSYVVDGGTLQLQRPITTKMACPGQAEAQVLKALEGISAYRITGGMLYLIGADGVVHATLRR